MSKSHIEEYLGDLLDERPSDQHHDKAEKTAEVSKPTQVHMKDTTDKISQAAWYVVDIQGLNIGLRAPFVETVIPAADMEAHTSAIGLGRVQWQGKSVTVVDLGALLIPKGRDRQFQARWLVVIKDKPYAVACQSHEILEFKEQEICWRSENTKRPWLAGTVMAKKCALIDIDALLPMLAGDSKI